MATDMDIDIDMDLDMGPIDEDMAHEATNSSTNDAMEAGEIPSTNGVNPQDESDVTEPAPDKVHLRGLDNLTTADLKSFAGTYHDADLITKIEWIDDTSANFVYHDSSDALNALLSFTEAEIADPSQLSTTDLLPAKAFPSHPNTRILVRPAVVGDRKLARARERSRFYLMNPEYDPAERRRGDNKGGRGGRKYRDRDDEGYSRNRYDRGEQRRREVGETFHASLYDDDEATVAARRQHDSRSSSGEVNEHRAERKTKELFPNRIKGDGRLRDRSASPARDGAERHASASSYKSRSDDRDRKHRGSDANRIKAQLVKSNLLAGPRNVELFPQKISPRHQRSNAFDAADETADLFAKKLKPRFLDGSDGTYMDAEDQSSRPLADRITNSGRSQNSAGLSIKGAARASAKELFPSKFNSFDNSGKELFSGKLEGRGLQRSRAEDMFQ